MVNVKKGRVTLERALSKLGHASRTEAKELIESGSVKVHGTVETNPRRMVNPDTAHLEVMGQKVKRAPSELYRFYKPRGCITTKRDPEGRQTIFDLLPDELQSFHAVGRLDQFTSGLLLLTNDSQLSHFLTDPQNEIERVYVAEVKGNFNELDRQRALQGLLHEGETLSARKLKILKHSEKESKIELVLVEGKNREIRRLCLALGHEVKSLIRVEYGPYALEELKPGEWRPVKILNKFN